MTSLLKTEVAAEFLSMSEGTLRWWRSVGRGPQFIKCGKVICMSNIYMKGAYIRVYVCTERERKRGE